MKIYNRTGKLIFDGAYLQGADLWGADLRGADLRGADLRWADLYGANLRGADLQEANLQGADLWGANLQGADLQGAILPNGKTLPQYIEWLPQGLLTQGGKTVTEVAQSWDGHTWTNCPMHAAFDAPDLHAVPACWRAEAATFVVLFDGGHLPRPIL